MPKEARLHSLQFVELMRPRAILAGHLMWACPPRQHAVLPLIDLALCLVGGVTLHVAERLQARWKDPVTEEAFRVILFSVIVIGELLVIRSRYRRLGFTVGAGFAIAIYKLKSATTSLLLLGQQWQRTASRRCPC